jgi:hypothetical protein
MKRAVLISLVLLVSAFAVSLALAQASGSFYLRRFSIAGGGGSQAAGGFELNGTVAQPAAGDLASGAFALRGGFCPGVLPPSVETPTATPTGSPGPAPTLTATLTPTPTATGIPSERKLYLPLTQR